MRFSVAVTLLFSFFFISCSSNKTISSAMNKYGHQDGVVSVSVPGWVLDLGGRIGDLAPDERQILKSIDKVKVLTIEDPELNRNVNFYDEFYRKVISKDGFEDLAMVIEDNDKIGILGRFKGDTVKELIILVGGDENTIVYLKGNITPEMINEIVSKDKDLAKSIEL